MKARIVCNINILKVLDMSLKAAEYLDTKEFPVEQGVHSVAVQPGW